MTRKHNGFQHHHSIPLHQFLKPEPELRGTLNFTLTPQEVGLINAIVERLRVMLEAHDPAKTAIAFNDLQLRMDLATIHCNDRRLNFSKLLASDATDFRMDMLAMHLFTDRTFGKLPNTVRLTCEENPL